MSSVSLEQLLFRLQQKSLIQSVPSLDANSKEALLRSLSSYDIHTLEKQIALCKKEPPAPAEYKPVKQYLTGEAIGSKASGEELLRLGKVGTIILAGGQGTRLGYDKPKGLFPISLIKQKSLFKRLLERADAVQLAYGKAPEIAVMTSQSTLQDTVEHFRGIASARDNIHIFCQEELPLLQEGGELSVDEQWSLRSGPDGNGALFWHFAKSGLLDLWGKKGIEYVTVVQIDNPMADPFSLELLSSHRMSGKDATAASVLRKDLEEQVGLFVESQGHIGVVEYSEMAQNDFYALDSKGNPQYGLANISYFVFSLPFIAHMARTAHCSLPLHKAKKQVPGTELELWKFEYFIFDLLATCSSQIVLLERSDCFAPLKSATGSSGVSAVQQALLERDRKQYYKVTGVEAPKDRLFELDMHFYYPTKELLAAWKGIPLPQAAYIDT